MIPITSSIEREKLPVATLSLIGVNALIYCIEIFLPADLLQWTLQHFGISMGSHDPLALFSSMFLHMGFGHILFNMLFLWIFGGPVEEQTGAKKFLLYYFGAGLSADALYLLMQLFSESGRNAPAVGASGAISGILGLYLYRYFYSKVKLVVTFFIFPRPVNLPAAPLILCWFFQNLIFGLTSFTAPVGIAFWAHIGGFLFGIAVGRQNRYGRKGEVEHLKEKILQKLGKKGRWETVERELHTLVNLAPNDPEVHHDLARLYLEKQQINLSQRHYHQAVRNYFLRDPLTGAFTVLEFLDTFSKTMAPQHHLKSAEVFHRHQEEENACKVLAPFAKSETEKSAIVEKLLVYYIKLLLHLNQRRKAREVYQGPFAKNFHDSLHLQEIKDAVKKAPGEVIPIEQAPPRPAPDNHRPAMPDQRKLRVIAWMEKTISDPAFWSILVFLYIASPFYFRVLPTPKTSILLFALAFLMTIVHRMGSIGEIFAFLTGASNKKRAREVDQKMLLDRARLAEQTRQHQEAVHLYEKVLRLDPENAEVRYHAARLYHEKLRVPRKALRYYRMVLEHLPPSHLFHRFSKEAIRELEAGDAGRGK